VATDQAQPDQNPDPVGKQAPSQGNRQVKKRSKKWNMWGKKSQSKKSVSDQSNVPIGASLSGCIDGTS